MAESIDLKGIKELCQFFPGDKPEEWEKKIKEALRESEGVPDLLLAENCRGETLAHILAYNGLLPERFFIPGVLALADKDGNAVVHILAKRKDLPEKYFTREWLSLKNKDGWMAAHNAAWQGRLPAKFLTEEILNLEEENGWIVGNTLLQRDKFPPEMLGVKFLEKPLFAIQLVFCFRHKDPVDRIQYASRMPTESLEYVLRNEDIPKIEGAEWLIDAVKKVLERTAEQEAFEGTGSAGGSEAHPSTLWGRRDQRAGSEGAG